MWVEAGAVVLAFVLFGVGRWYIGRKRLGLPGPWGLPFFYNFFEIIHNKDRIYDWFLDTTLKYGPIWAVSAPSKPWIVIVTDTQNIDYVLRTNFTNYVKGPNLINILHDFLGDGIFNTNGRNWKLQRQTASHLFKVRELKHMVDIFLSHGHQVIEILQRKEGQQVDMQELFARFTLDSIGEIAFGKKIGSLDQPVAFSIAFNRAQVLTDARFQKFWWKWMSWIESERELRGHIKVLDDFAYSIIKERRQDPDIHKKTDLLSRYLMMTDDNGEPFTDKYLRDIILNFMIAGRDTTSQALTWCFYLLSCNPEAKAKLVAEVDSQLGGKDPAFDTVDNLPFLHAVVNETLRLYPPVPVDSKSALKDDVLPDGTFIHAGSSVNYPIWVLNRLPQYWDRPNDFWPERWLQDGKVAEGGHVVPKNNSLPFIPFNFGPRTCLGMKMAYLEIKMMAVLLLQNVDLTLAPNQEVKYLSAITLSAKNGIRMVPRVRSDASSRA